MMEIDKDPSVKECLLKVIERLSSLETNLAIVSTSDVEELVSIRTYVQVLADREDASAASIAKPEVDYLERRRHAKDQLARELYVGGVKFAFGKGLIGSGGGLTRQGEIDTDKFSIACYDLAEVFLRRSCV